MLKLNKISLEGYKSIRQCQDLKLEKLNVLIGGNGSGKSNLLSLFALLNAAMRGELQVFIGRKGAARSFLHFGPKVTAGLTVNLEFDSETETNLYGARLIFAEPDHLVFAEELFRTTPKPGSTVTFSELIGRGANESAVVLPGFRDNQRLQFFATFLGGIRTYHFHDTSERADIRLSRRVEDHRRLYSYGENLAAVLWHLRDHHSNAYARIVETVRLVAPFFGEFIVDSPATLPGHALLNWRAKGSDYELGPHQLSDGTLRFMALATLLLQPADLLPDVIVIDEPELGLHPFGIKILASLLQDAANFTQIIVATQSPALVDQMEPEDVIVTEIENGASRFERLDRDKLKAWLDEYSLSPGLGNESHRGTAVSWVRLYLTVEGQAELLFARSTLRAHLANYEVDVRARMIPTNRKLGSRGGAVSFERFKRDAATLMKDDANKEARFSTLINLYALPSAYSGWEEARKRVKPVERVLELEKALARELGDPRFIPFLQLHEFEALLYCDLRQVEYRVQGSESAIGALQREVAGLCPEDIDEGETTAPSKRLIRHVPRYEKLKVSVGAPSAAAIGLPVLREKCPHFGQWLTRLENLKQTL